MNHEFYLDKDVPYFQSLLDTKAIVKDVAKVFVVQGLSAGSFLGTYIYI